MNTSVGTSGRERDQAEDGYGDFERLVFARVGAATLRLFTTSAEGLFSTYLGGLPQESRQHYRCRSCERFVEKYGGLVTIDDAGVSRSIFWNSDDVPPFFRESASSLREKIEASKVTGVFLSPDKTWGTPLNKSKDGVAWSHLSGKNPVVFSDPLISAEQKMAEKKQDYMMLRGGMADYSQDVVEQAVRILEADALDRSEKTLGVAKWLLGLYQAINIDRSKFNRAGYGINNLIWKAVATAPPGWCHLRSTMIHTLLDDLKGGRLTFETIKSRWSAKMHPMQYQRPTAPPKDGAIEQAEKVVETLKSAGALERRYARLDEVVAMWRPWQGEKMPEVGKGVFGHLKPKEVAQQIALPTTTVTWEKFQRTVLGNAMSIEFMVPYQPMPYFCFVTAANPDSPPILQWDREEQRNPVSWYFPHPFTHGRDWNLLVGHVRVNAICRKPCHWHGTMDHVGQGVFFVLEGAKDVRANGTNPPSGGFFPESLRSEYHSVRSVMEAYSNNAKVAGHAEGTANGVALDKGSKFGITLTVTTSLGVATYQIDRLD